MDNEIIVDNVDVSSCKSFCENYGEYHQGYWEDNEICYLHNNHCSDNKNCYYKQLLVEQAKNKKLVEALEDIELECNKGQDNIKKSNNHHDGMIYGLGHLEQKKDYIHLFSKYLALNEVNNEKTN